MPKEQELPFDVEPLSPGLKFGKVVAGLELEQLESEAVRTALRNLWIQDGLILFRNQAIDERFHLELSRIFGELEPHPVVIARTAGFPELTTIKSSNTIFEIDGVQGAGFIGWHRDLSYVERINHGGILRSIRPSSSGGITGFLDLIAAYDSLSDELKARIEHLDVVYKMAPYDRLRFGTDGLKLISVAEQIVKVWERADVDFPPVVHPAVFVQPETGRKVLNISPFFANSIEGMENPEGDALLQQLCDHVCGSPAYHHKWSTSDLILWDNWRMLHCVSLVPLDQERIMQRTTIKGDYGVGRKLRENAVAA